MQQEDGLDEITMANRELAETVVQLALWCKTHFGEVFSAWVHIKAIRLFVESVLRYGLPANFAAALIQPGKAEKKARDILFRLYHDHDKSGMMMLSADDSAAAAGAGAEELFPYVSYSIQPLSKDD